MAALGNPLACLGGSRRVKAAPKRVKDSPRRLHTFQAVVDSLHDQTEVFQSQNEELHSSIAATARSQTLMAHQFAVIQNMWMNQAVHNVSAGAPTIAPSTGPPPSIGFLSYNAGHQSSTTTSHQAGPSHNNIVLPPPSPAAQPFPGISKPFYPTHLFWLFPTTNS
ncbi:hypothetical protein ACLB2K_015102 [Fragaria x ananassa]